jgi:RNA polymerase sigma-70 factor (ECF subfamily)
VAPQPSPSTDSTQWLAAARAGDAQAFGQLYACYAPMVHAVLLSHAAPADVDDLLQEVFLAAWRGLGGLRDEQAVGGWLAVIARHAAQRQVRRSRSQPEPLPDELPDTRGSDGSYRARGDELLAVLRELPPVYRESLAMRLVEGMSGPEIAAATGLSPGSVRTHLSRGLQLLRERLARRGWR